MAVIATFQKANASRSSRNEIRVTRHERNSSRGFAAALLAACGGRFQSRSGQSMSADLSVMHGLFHFIAAERELHAGGRLSRNPNFIVSVCAAAYDNPPLSKEAGKSMPKVVSRVARNAR